MSVTTRLVFDPTAAASSHSVGAYVVASDGSLIAATSNALHVSVQNATLAVTQSGTWNVGTVTTLTGITNVVHVDDNSGSLTVDGTVAATQSGTWDVGTVTTITNVVHIDDNSSTISIDDGGGAITVDGSVTVSATDLDIRDLTHVSDSVKIGDGTDVMLVNADGSINCVVTGDTSDNALANTAIAATAKAVSTSLIDLVTSPLSARKYLFAANLGNKIVYLGTTATTAADGFPLEPGCKMEIRAGASIALKVIGETGASSEDVRVLELS